MDKEETTEPITLKQLQDAEKIIKESGFVLKTPLLQNVQHLFPSLDESMKLYLKLENMQNTGSFKIRGLINQFQFLPEEIKNGEKTPITMSSGSYGKAYGFLLSKLGIKGICVMPDGAPSSRVGILENYGIEVIKKPVSELQKTIDEYVAEKNCVFMHSIDDVSLSAGYGSAGFEILEDLPDPDVVVVCCGGGGLVSGVAASIKLAGPSDCRIYAVEPEGARTMHESFKVGKAVGLPVETIATGLAPPYTGKSPFAICRKFVEEVILVTDEEIKDCMKKLYGRGLVVEPSGSAGMTALMRGRIPDVANKKVVVVITGGNFTPNEMADLLKF